MSPVSQPMQWCASVFAWLVLALGGVIGQTAEPQEKPQAKPLTRIADIRALSREQAAQQIPVRLRASFSG